MTAAINVTGGPPGRHLIGPLHLVITGDRDRQHLLGRAGAFPDREDRTPGDEQALHLATVAPGVTATEPVAVTALRSSRAELAAAFPALPGFLAAAATATAAPGPGAAVLLLALSRPVAGEEVS